MTDTRMRRDIRALEADQLRRLRLAFARLQSDTSPQGYQALAGYHGVPDWHCPHGTALFLPWHREYILRIETALRAIDDMIDLPYFDWTDDRAVQDGLPVAYTDTSYRLADGTLIPNPLSSASAGALGRPTRRAASWNPAHLRSFAQSVDLAYEKTSFGQFSRGLEGPHGSFHVWVGGDMGGPSYAAYDPLFWAHHTAVDRQWARWQKSDNGAAPSPSLLAQPLPGFPGRRVSDVIDHSTLGYGFAGLGAAPGDIFAAAPPSSARTEGGASRAMSGSTRSRASKPRIVLEVVGARRDSGSFAADVFVNLPDAGPDTPIQSNANFAGAFGILGMAGAHGGRAHHSDHAGVGLAPDEVSTDALSLEVDITEAVERLGLRTQDIEVTLVARTADGIAVDPRELPIDGIRVAANQIR